MSLLTIRHFTKLVFDEYAKEFGQRKALTLVQNLSDSTLLTKALKLWDAQNHVPTYQDLQKVVGAINWFVFSKRETTAIGMLIALARWDEQVNKYNRLAARHNVMQIAFDTLDWLKVYSDEAYGYRALMQFESDD